MTWRYIATRWLSRRQTNLEGAKFSGNQPTADVLTAQGQELPTSCTFFQFEPDLSRYPSHIDLLNDFATY